MPEGFVTTSKKDSKSAVSKFGYFFKAAIKEIKEATFPLVNFAWKSRDDKCVHTNKHFVMSYVWKIFIEKGLRNLKRQKATGIDNLPPGLLKDCTMYIATPLCYIINLSIINDTDNLETCQQMDSDKLIRAIYLDLTKAFDTIGHNVLIDKLPKFGIRGKSLDWFVDYIFSKP